MKTEIDLETFKTPGSKVFTGRERGIDVRTKSKIDELEVKYDSIFVKIPKDVMSLNPSFLEEFLYNVVKKLGKDDFNKKFTFLTESTRYDFKEDLNEAVERILRKENALSKK